MRYLVVAGAVALALTACGPKAAVSEAPVAEAADARVASVPEVGGKPMWTATKSQTAEENAKEAFDRNGAAFKAADVDAYVRQAHAFTSDPPAGAEALKRANGDTLIYEPASNTFAVVTEDGAPRTMFKPDDGAAYWAKQKDSVSAAKAKAEAKTKKAQG